MTHLKGTVTDATVTAVLCITLHENKYAERGYHYGIQMLTGNLSDWKKGNLEKSWNCAIISMKETTIPILPHNPHELLFGFFETQIKKHREEFHEKMNEAEEAKTRLRSLPNPGDQNDEKDPLSS